MARPVGIAPGPLAWRGAVRPCSGRCARPARPPGCLDLRVPRGPDQQRRRVHGHVAGARPGPRARRPRGPPAARFEADRRAAPGRWRVKDAKLIPLWTACRRTLAGFERWSAAHVPRAQNSVADALANEAIDRVSARRARRPWSPATVTRPSGVSRRSAARSRRRRLAKVSEAVGWSRRRSWGDPSAGVRKVRAPQRRVAGNARPP